MGVNSAAQIQGTFILCWTSRFNECEMHYKYKEHLSCVEHQDSMNVKCTTNTRNIYTVLNIKIQWMQVVNHKQVQYLKLAILGKFVTVIVWRVNHKQETFIPIENQDSKKEKKKENQDSLWLCEEWIASRKHLHCVPFWYCSIILSSTTTYHILLNTPGILEPLHGHVV